MMQRSFLLLAALLVSLLSSTLQLCDALPPFAEKIYDFYYPTSGSGPLWAPAPASNGALFQILSDCSASSYPCQYLIAKIQNSVYSTVFTFPLSICSNPSSPLARSPGDGYFYGLCSSGGLSNSGTIYRFDALASVVSPSKVFDFTNQSLSGPAGQFAWENSSGEWRLVGSATVGGANAAGGLFQFRPATGLLSMVVPITVQNWNSLTALIWSPTDSAVFASMTDRNAQGVVAKLAMPGGVLSLAVSALTMTLYPSPASVLAANGCIYGYNQRYRNSIWRFCPSSGSLLQNFFTFANSDDAGDPALATLNGNEYLLVATSNITAIDYRTGQSYFGAGFQQLGVEVAPATAAPVLAADGYFYGISQAGGAFKLGCLFRFSSSNLALPYSLVYEFRGWAAAVGIRPSHGIGYHGPTKSFLMPMSADKLGNMNILSFNSTGHRNLTLGSSKTCANFPLGTCAFWATGANTVTISATINPIDAMANTFSCTSGRCSVVSQSTRFLAFDASPPLVTTFVATASGFDRFFSRAAYALLPTKNFVFYGFVQFAQFPSLINAAGDNQFQSVLATFNSASFGLQPVGDPLLLNNSLVVGLLKRGGAFGVGSIFNASIASGSVKSIYSFSPSSIFSPVQSLIESSPGIVLGACESGGAFGLGGIFTLNLTTANFSLVAPFESAMNVSSPFVQGSDGNFYALSNIGSGSLFRVSLSPGQPSITTVYSFSGRLGDGAAPVGPIVSTPDGRLLIATTAGGLNNSGTIFSVSQSCLTGGLQTCQPFFVAPLPQSSSTGGSSSSSSSSSPSITSSSQTVTVTAGSLSSSSSSSGPAVTVTIGVTWSGLASPYSLNPAPSIIKYGDLVMFYMVNTGAQAQPFELCAGATGTCGGVTAHIAPPTGSGIYLQNDFFLWSANQTVSYGSALNKQVAGGIIVIQQPLPTLSSSSSSSTGRSSSSSTVAGVSSSLSASSPASSTAAVSTPSQSQSQSQTGSAAAPSTMSTSISSTAPAAASSISSTVTVTSSAAAVSVSASSLTQTQSQSQSASSSSSSSSSASSSGIATLSSASLSSATGAGTGTGTGSSTTMTQSQSQTAASASSSLRSSTISTSSSTGAATSASASASAGQYTSSSMYSSSSLSPTSVPSSFSSSSAPFVLSADSSVFSASTPAGLASIIGVAVGGLLCLGLLAYCARSISLRASYRKTSKAYLGRRSDTELLQINPIA